MPVEALYALGLLIVIGSFAYGLYRSRTRNRANDPVRDEAVRQSYDDPVKYEQGGEQSLKRQLKPED